MKKLFLILALAALWLVLVVRNIPAQWGLWVIDSPLQMEGISGTLWSGRAANTVLPFQGDSYALGQLEWELSPWSLLAFNPCVVLSSEYQSQSFSGDACVSLSGAVELSNVMVNLPAEMAQLWLPIQIQGDLIFRIESLKVEDNHIQKLVGKGRWDEAYYHNSFDWMKLGAIAFDFKESPDGGVLTEVVDVEGPLKLDLLYEFSLEGSYQLRGDIIPQANAPQELVQLLMAVADEKEKNHFYIEWAGS